MVQTDIDLMVVSEHWNKTAFVKNVCLLPACLSSSTKLKLQGFKNEKRLHLFI